MSQDLEKEIDTEIELNCASRIITMRFFDGISAKVSYLIKFQKIYKVSFLYFLGSSLNSNLKETNTLSLEQNSSPQNMEASCNLKQRTLLIVHIHVLSLYHIPLCSSHCTN